MTATDPQTAPVTPPRPRKSHRTIIALAVLSAAVIGGTIAGLAITASSHPAAAPQWTSTFTPSPPQPAASTAPAVTAMAAWCAGAGNAALRHVYADLGQVGTDANAGNLAATEADGTRLTADAEAAETLPPPVTHARQVSYTEAMGAASFAGIDLSAGSLAAANRAMTAASGYLGQDKGIIDC